MNQVVTTEVRNSFSESDVELIKTTVCKGATDSELKLFLHQAKSTGLNPLARQIYAVKRWDAQENKNVMSMQVSIDGFRLIAERTGKYAGQTTPQWCGEDGIWKDVWLAPGAPAASRVGILRSDFKEPCWGVARFEAYAQRKKDGALFSMWAKMGDVMIAKCAESLGLRKAFPQELSGLYTGDEMGQADNSVVDNTPVETKKPSIFKNASLRNKFTATVKAEFEAASAKDELEFYYQENSGQITAMKEGDEHDLLAVDEIRKCYDNCLRRIKAEDEQEVAASFGAGFAGVSNEPDPVEVPKQEVPGFLRRVPQE